MATPSFLPLFPPGMYPAGELVKPRDSLASVAWCSGNEGPRRRWRAPRRRTGGPTTRSPTRTNGYGNRCTRARPATWSRRWSCRWAGDSSTWAPAPVSLRGRSRAAPRWVWTSPTGWRGSPRQGASSRSPSRPPWISPSGTSPSMRSWRASCCISFRNTRPHSSTWPGCCAGADGSGSPLGWCPTTSSRVPGGRSQSPTRRERCWPMRSERRRRGATRSPIRDGSRRSCATRGSERCTSTGAGTEPRSPSPIGDTNEVLISVATRER
jgi:hypothetical protein